MREIEKALESQKSHLEERHQLILKNYSEQNKAKYKENFDKAVNFYKSEISDLNQKLDMANKRVLTSNIRTPLFSSGRYSSRETSPVKSTVNNAACSCKLIQCAPKKSGIMDLTFFYTIILYLKLPQHFLTLNCHTVR